MILEIIFFLSVLMIVYGFVGYPILLRLLVFLKYNSSSSDAAAQYTDTELPTITLLISVYNEEDVIEKKILNSLSLDYPLDKLEILVVSDGANDSTDDIIKSFSNKGVKLLRQATRAGKTAALNMAVPQAQGELIVFSDANSMYDKSALRKMARHFSQLDIGFVTGRTKYISNTGHTVAETTGMYTRLEMITKRLESQISSCVGADGAIFTIRKKLYQPLRDFDINDLVIPLDIVGQGYRGIMDSEAYCLEETAKNFSGEFNRQTRITCRTIRAIYNYKALLNSFRYPFFSFALLSHKIVKLMLPFCMAAALVSNILLAPSNMSFQTLLGGQFLFYFLFFVGYLQRDKDGARVPLYIYILLLL